MVEPILHIDSMRAKKARLGARLTWTWRSLIMLLAVMLGMGGLMLVLAGSSFGWLVFSLVVAPVMLLEWWRGELQNVPKDPKSTSVEGILAADVVGQLTTQSPSPRDIATIAGKTRSGMFFAARYGIGARFLQEIASDDPQQTQNLWKEADEVRQQTDSTMITGAVLVVALIRCFDNYEALLAHMQLSVDDLYAGVRWHTNLQDLVSHHSRPRRTGGIARDWSFGYVPTLMRFGQNISEQIGRGGLLSIHLVAHQRVIDQLISTFSSGGRQNVALIGPTGAGKTTIVNVFADRLLDANGTVPDSLKFRQVFALDAATLISAAPGRGELEGLVMRVLGEAYSAKNIIIFLDNAQLFFEEGVGSVDLSNVLLPIIEAGRLKMIFAMDEQRFLQISARNSPLANALNRVTVSPVSKEETIEVMQNQLVLTEHRNKVTYMYQSLEEAYRLSERYIHDLAMPGRAMKLLDSAASYAESGFVTQKSVQQAIEQTMDIKIGVASDDDEREKLLNLEDLIHKRMINQTRAVTVVSDALRRARAGVRNQNRPIGTFLFLGPTGVGKTELAKALADVYFGGENSIIRLDLNEYVRPDDVVRLLADGANDPMSLTAQIMKQPFSVVLLDEIEKAHPQVLTTLLQLLDEGILRDEKNREVSFRDAIIIATSNAGADRIREYIERGYRLEQFEEQFTNELISTNQFRPEFLNRFDEIVIFRPLTKEELLQVVDLILAGINKNLALQKLSIDVELSAKQYLVEVGYDPRLGARPMRRVIQRAVENTIAKRMLAGQAVPGEVMQLSLAQVQQALGANDTPSISANSSSQM